MTYKATYGDYYQNETVCYTTNICIGDIVVITNVGKVFPEYEGACYAVWKNKHTTHLSKTWSEKEWRVIGFVGHEFPSYGILVGLQDRNFEQAIVEAESIKLVRKKVKDTQQEINVEIAK